MSCLSTRTNLAEGLIKGVLDYAKFRVVVLYEFRELLQLLLIASAGRFAPQAQVEPTHPSSFATHTHSEQSIEPVRFAYSNQIGACRLLLRTRSAKSVEQAVAKSVPNFRLGSSGTMHNESCLEQHSVGNEAA